MGEGISHNSPISKSGVDEAFGSYWCNSCPKCAFVYSILRPFLSKEETLQIFSRELYEDKSLETLFRELLGIS
jgi:UDP-N-acetyl-alpha-D-muramoyl-L-alanyl-L-glutamate epimerase